MTKKVITISHDKTVEDASRIMYNRKIKRLPVIKNDKLVGEINLADVISYAKGIDEGDFFFN